MRHSNHHLHKNQIFDEDEAQCKIRKRGCSSSASSSASSSLLLHNYRFNKRPICATLLGERPKNNTNSNSRSTTPVPNWKIMMNSRSSQSPEYLPPPPGNGGSSRLGKVQQQQQHSHPPLVSARKLAATLWEMNEMPSAASPRILELEHKELTNTSRRRKGRGRASERIPNSGLSHLSDPSHSPVSDRMGHSRRASTTSRRLRRPDHHHCNDGGGGGDYDSVSSASYMEIEMRSRGRTPPGSSTTGAKTRLKDLSNGLTTSKELLKILNRIWGLEEQHSSGVSLISALHTEIERSRLLVDQMIREKRSDRHEIDDLVKRLADEKALWKSKEQERMRAAFDSVAADLGVERKHRRRTEILIKKLGTELSETKAALLKTMQELESEKRKRQMMEQVCDELAIATGEDKIDSGEIKRESAKVREEAKKEKEMLQLADLLRKERLQTKLSEAQYQYEEKNADVDQLGNELGVFLSNKMVKENRGASVILPSNKEEMEAYLSRRLLASDQNQLDSEDDEGELEDGEEYEEEGRHTEHDEDSADSDLIELNVDKNRRGHGWRSYTNGLAASDNQRRALAEEEIKGGRNSLSDRIQRGRVSLERRNSGGTDLEFGREDSSKWAGGFGQSKQNLGSEDYEDNKVHGYRSAKGLRDHVLSDSKMQSNGGFASPTRKWGQILSSRHPGNLAAHGKPAVVPESAPKTRLVETARVEGRNSRCSRQ
ncbi:uncharacterized protein At5g41620-like [Papaver somniferum]|uniref:uncharacterized protein At5g41620-like n=1 Tax=Papaver somniferum TaxID=3469 RepID=UPI000E6FBF14|nr:uncharacterized protein At5g41620-like [Papaver somniferum]